MNGDDFNLKNYQDRISKWITEGIKDTEVVQFADEFGRFISMNRLTTSQIRNVFGEMRRIQMKGFDSERTSFILLKPKLAYAVKRHGGKGLSKFYDLFKMAYESVNPSKDGASTRYDNFISLVEAILAFHKFHGGKD